jgi:hypothetical protein
MQTMTAAFLAADRIADRRREADTHRIARRPILSWPAWIRAAVRQGRVASRIRDGRQSAAPAATRA